METGAGITSGTVKCAVKVGTKAIAAAGKVGGRCRSVQAHAAEDVEGQARHRDDHRHLQGQLVTVPFSFKVN